VRADASIDGVTLDAIAGVAGDGAAFALVEARGGRRVYIPHETAATDSELAKIVGLDAALRLAKRYGPRRFTPARRWRLMERVVQLDEHGLSRAAIAERLGCTERAVYGLLERARDGGLVSEVRRRCGDPAQGSLFG
jgi:CRP-like cAMP-binding protein